MSYIGDVFEWEEDLLKNFHGVEDKEIFHCIEVCMVLEI